MKVYLTGAFEPMDVRVGFGNAAFHIYKNLIDLGVDARIKQLGDDSRYEADIEICFDQPDKYRFMCPTSHKIGYTPWESSDFMSSWYQPLQMVDEIWTTSHWNATIFKDRLPDRNIFTYQHGIDHEYKPKKRKRNPNEPFTFLFIGEPYYRKDGKLVAQTFIDLFGNNPNYRLIIKATHISTITAEDKEKKISGTPDAVYNNIIVITKMLNKKEMMDLYNYADVFVYPSWGEGFGFNPLQSMAMGIPTISTSAWSDYKQYITVPISSIPVPSPWPSIHPGWMLKPNVTEFQYAMSSAESNYEELSSLAFKNSFRIHEDFDWVKVTLPAVKRLKNIYKNRELKTLA